MGTITVTINDDVEERLRTFVFKKFKGKGHHLGETINEALIEYLDLHQSEVE